MRSDARRTTSHKSPVISAAPSITALYIQASPITSGTKTEDARQKAEVMQNC